MCNLSKLLPEICLLELGILVLKFLHYKSLRQSFSCILKQFSFTSKQKGFVLTMKIVDNVISLPYKHAFIMEIK